jgi:hypothetical protein
MKLSTPQRLENSYGQSSPISHALQDAQRKAQQGQSDPFRFADPNDL